MAWAARLDNGKGYELNVKPVNILSSTGRVEDEILIMFLQFSYYYSLLIMPKLTPQNPQLSGSESSILSRSQAPAWECILSNNNQPHQKTTLIYVSK
jgi:hypothetical protein